MSNTRSEQEAIGVRLVAQIVREKWKARFQELDSRNDDGIDGIIFLGKNGQATGETIFVQIKCGPAYKVEIKGNSNQFYLNVGSEYIEKHRPRWNRYPGPVILVYVDSSTDKTMPKAWWTNLKSADTYCLSPLIDWTN